MIIVDSRGGLANRMQAIDSAMSLARDLDRQLWIPWVINTRCGACFDQLFVEMDRIGKFFHFETDDEADGFIDRRGSSLLIDHYLQPWCDIANAQMLTSLGDVGELHRHPAVIIRSWARFYPTPDPFKNFTPIEWLRDRVMDVTARFDRTVGIHIRRTDHRDAIMESPTSAFKRTMREIRDSGEASSFFLSADDPAEEVRLRREFSIVTYPKRSFDRASVRGVQDAVVDLFCLAATRRIIGSAGSTFSVVASGISGAPLTVAHADGGGFRSVMQRAVRATGGRALPMTIRPLAKARSLAKRIARVAAKRLEKRDEARLYKQIPGTSPVPSEFFEGLGDVRVHIVCYERLNDWVLGKISLRLCEHVRMKGVSCTLGHAPDPSANINHHICFLGFDGKRTTNDTLMITHVDIPPKGELELLRCQINSVDMGACMSTATMNFLAAKGIPRSKLSFINPAHDGKASPRRVRIGIAQRIYPDGRKREHLLLDLAAKISSDDFSFQIMSSGWKPIVKQLRAMGFQVDLYDRFVRSEYEDLFRSMDYYLYWGIDEGSLGFLDALAAGVGTIVSAQGFHLDAREGVTYLFADEAELYGIFGEIAAEKRRRQQAVRDWSWENYAYKHLLMWNRILALKAGRPLPDHLKRRLGEIGLDEKA